MSSKPATGKREQVRGETHFEVSRFEASKYVGGKLQFLVKFKGFPKAEWLPAGGPERRRLSRAAQGDESNVMHPCLYISQSISNSVVIFYAVAVWCDWGVLPEFRPSFG